MYVVYIEFSLKYTVCVMIVKVNALLDIHSV